MLRRRLVAVVVLAVLPLIGSEVLLGSSPAVAKSITVQAPRVSTQQPIGTERVTLTGSIGRTVTRTVKLQRRAGGRWHDAARRVVGPRGRYSFSVAMPGPVASWRVTSPPLRRHDKRWNGRTSRVRTVHRAVQTATATTARSVRVGTPTSVALSFTPVRPGRRASVQIDDGSGWRTVVTVAQNGAGRATYRLTPTVVGAWQVRTVAASYHGAGQVVGPSASLAVLRTEPIEVAAHRGASLRNPENTVPAIRNAVRLGADWLELDLRALKPDPDPDGAGPQTEQAHFVLMHDASFLRTTDVEQVFPARKADGTATFSWPEVQRLDAGSWKGSRFVGTRVPDLRMTLDAIDAAEQETGRHVRAILEFKGSSPAVMAALYDQVKALRPGWISADGHDDKVVFMSFGYATVFDALRQGDRADGGVELAGVMDTASDPTYDWLSQMHVDSRIASTTVSRQVRAAGSRVGVWTVDSPESILRAATAGADIVTTDDIETARSLLLR